MATKEKGEGKEGKKESEAKRFIQSVLDDIESSQQGWLAFKSFLMSKANTQPPSSSSLPTPPLPSPSPLPASSPPNTELKKLASFGCVHFPSGGDVSVQIAQPLKQRKNSCCGYYALYSCLTSKMADSLNDDRWSELQINRACFWFFYNFCILILMKEVKRREALDEDFSPWTREDVEAGVLERSFLHHLLQAFGVEEEICTLSEFGLSTLRSCSFPGRSIKKLEGVMERVKESQSQKEYILIGVTHHWVACLISKSSPTQVDVIMFDCFDVNSIKFSTSVELQEYIKEEYRANTPKEKAQVKEVLSTINFLLKLFQEVMASEKQLGATLLSDNLHGFIETFNREMKTCKENVAKKGVQKGSDSDKFNIVLMDFFQEYLPVPVFEQSLVEGFHHADNHWVTHEICDTLDTWIAEVQKKSNNFQYDDQQVQRFARAIQHLSKFSQQKRSNIQ